MALQKNITAEGKVVVQTAMGDIDEGVRSISLPAYIKVLSVSGTKTEINALVSFTSGDKNLFKQYQIPMSVEAGSVNFIAQAYAHLKTLPEFAGAIDC